VLQGVEEHEEQRQALLLLKVLARGEGEYRSGRVQGHNQAKVYFARKLRELSQRDSQV